MKRRGAPGHDKLADAATTRQRSWGSRPGRSYRRGLSLLVATALTSVVGMALMAGPASADASDLSVLGGSYDPAADVNSMYNTTAYSGATAWWNAGYTGAGVDVALIDTGVSPVPGLDGAGKVVNGPDLSIESQNPSFQYLDTNGHGTFMAGLIAGHDAALRAPYATAPASAYRGMAPDARIVNVKVGVADGGVDVTQVIAAIDWVVQHAHDGGQNIRVISLSYGTNSAQSYLVDPLAYAAEQAWKHGILVVAAGGNYGFHYFRNGPALSNPAIDPYLLAVGSSDSNRSTQMNDDYVSLFSPWPKRGCPRNVDMVAPGAHLQGLRVPNSSIDMNHPTGRIDDRYFRGSGTSESTALTAGAAALVFQRYPDATPDQVKALLTGTGYRIFGLPLAMGGGELQLSVALTTPLTPSVQTWPASTGTGSVELARGADHLIRDSVQLAGEQDIFGHAFDSGAVAALEADGVSWSGGTWNGNSWSGNSWSGNSWSGVSWTGVSWSGNSWSGNSWSGNSWSGNSWSGNSWSGNSWSGNSWSGASWASDSWA